MVDIVQIDNGRCPFVLIILILLLLLLVLLAPVVGYGYDEVLEQFILLDALGLPIAMLSLVGEIGSRGNGRRAVVVLPTILVLKLLGCMLWELGGA